MVLELSVYLSGIIALIVRIVTVAVMVFVMINFGRGLKEKGLQNTLKITNE